jgi:DNA-binding NarL/FixJ family response regulator
VRYNGLVIRVYLLDDHEIVRRGLIALLEAAGDIEVVGESGSALEAARRIPALRPDVAVLDARLPDGSGIDVCRDVRSADPQIRALILTSYQDDEALFSAIMAGAAGYVLKQIKGTDLVDAVRRVAAGQSLLDPMVTQQVLERIRHGSDNEPEELSADPGTDRAGDDESSDRRPALPGREDGEELRLQPACQARPGTADPGRDPG